MAQLQLDEVVYFPNNLLNWSQVPVVLLLKSQSSAWPSQYSNLQQLLQLRTLFGHRNVISGVNIKSNDVKGPFPCPYNFDCWCQQAKIRSFPRAIRRLHHTFPKSQCKKSKWNQFQRNLVNCIDKHSWRWSEGCLAFQKFRFYSMQFILVNIFLNSDREHRPRTDSPP